VRKRRGLGIDPRSDRMAIPPPAGNVGSGKFGTPCLRMHRALAIAAWRCAAETGGGGPPPPGSSFLHAFSAAWNAGPLKVMPSTVSASLPGVLLTPWKPSPPGPALGSGKFETPWVRMHFDSANGELSPVAVVPWPVGVEPEPPQAAIVMAQMTPASRMLRWRMRPVVPRGV